MTTLIVLGPHTAELVRSLTALQLSTIAKCDAPESDDSRGGLFLKRTADALIDFLENNDQEIADRDILEIAADMPHVSSVGKWEEWVDLRAWREDVVDVTGGRIDPRELTEHADTVLSLIAERLIRGLVRSLLL